jgi:two-component system cell cycle response regulator
MTRILVVDNSYINIELLKSTFEPFGYEIIAAQDIQEGLRLAAETQPDLILSDVHLPGGDGFEFIQVVKADPELSSIPFLFISSTIWGDKDQIRGLTLGAQKFIIRPIEPQDLLRAVEACLKG